MAVDSLVGITAKTMSIDLLDIEGVNVEISKYKNLQVTYSCNFRLNRQTSPTQFIPDFLESKGYEPIETRRGHKFDHSKDYSILQSIHNMGYNNPSINVILNMDGPSKVSFLGRNAEELSIANDLVLLMMLNYAK